MAGRRERLAMQDWRAFPSYLSQTLWAQVLDKEVPTMAIVESIVKALISLELRAPTEPYACCASGQEEWKGWQSFGAEAGFSQLQGSGADNSKQS